MIRKILLVFLLALGQQTLATTWDGPTTGPFGQSGKSVLFMSQDFKNGGIMAVLRSFEEAARELNWKVTLVNCDGSRRTVREEFSSAYASRKFDAIVLGGIDQEDVADLHQKLKREGVLVVGWHAAAKPGSTKILFANVTTDPAEVAIMAARLVGQSGRGRAGVVIFNDDRFDIANYKAKVMRDTIKRCKRCSLLAVENIKISEAATEVPQAVPRLNKRHGSKWTHSLAINDVYFDDIHFPLLFVNRPDVQNIAAGDGSAKALRRIKSGLSQQIATVAEPTGIHGWQLADELNRGFSGAPMSGYVSKPILVTTQFLATQNSDDIDSGIAFREAYRAIWKRR